MVVYPFRKKGQEVTMKKLNERITNLTREEIRLYGKSPSQILASLIEELGELAAALKIHFGLVKHKSLSEPVTGEASDLYICAIMISSLHTNIDISVRRESWDDSFEALAAGACCVGIISKIICLYGKNKAKLKRHEENYIKFISACESLAGIAINIYLLNGGKKEDFTSIANAKLDKWEKNQKKLRETTSTDHGD